jgi:hypothetical protein
MNLKSCSKRLFYFYYHILKKVNFMDKIIEQSTSYSSPEDDVIIEEVIRQLDHVKWNLGAEDGEQKCYWSGELGNSPVIGFRRISFVENADIEEMARFHGEGIADVWAYLSKSTYSHGEYLEEYHKSKDVYHSLVRTMFDLPYGMASREYLHYLYRKRVDDNTILVIFRTPDDVSNIPPAKDKHIRCNIFNSGDRFQIQPDGRIKVEHLMTYTLEGGVTPWMADNLFKKAHIEAYFSEAKYVKEIFDNTAPNIPGNYPSQFNMYVSIERLNIDKLIAGVKQAFQDGKIAWKTLQQVGNTKVAVAKMPYSAFWGFKNETVLNLSIQQSAQILANEFIQHLSKWNSAFLHGEVLETLEKSEQRESWVVRTVQRETFPLKNREYTFLLVKETLESGQILIAYQSVLKFNLPVTQKAVRGNVYPGGFLLTPIDHNQTKVAQIEVKELNGKVSRAKQNGMPYLQKMAKIFAGNFEKLAKGI